MVEDYIPLQRVKDFFEDTMVGAVKHYKELLSKDNLSSEERIIYESALKAVQPLHLRYALTFPEILVKHKLI